MPRIGICLNLDDEQRLGWRWSAENDYYDFCRRCYSRMEPSAFATSNGVSLDAVEMNVEHPQYAGEEYHCHTCRKELTEEDE